MPIRVVLLVALCLPSTVSARPPTRPYSALRAVAAVERANRLLDARKLDEAILVLDAAVRLDPNNAQAYRLRGFAWLEKKDMSRAAADYDQAVRLDPANVRFRCNRADAWDLGGERERALADLAEAIRLAPDEVSLLYLARAKIHAARGADADAARDMAAAKGSGLKSAAAYYHRARSWVDLGQYEAAVPDLDEALRLDPSDARALCLRGTMCAASKAYDLALSYLERALKANPDLVTAHSNRASALCMQGKWRDAIAALDQVIRLDPNDSHAVMNRAMSWYSLGETEKAVRGLFEAIRIDPKNAAAYANLGTVRWATNPDLALLYYSDSLRIDPDQPPVYLDRAKLWAEKREWANAVKDLDEVLRPRRDGTTVAQTRRRFGMTTYLGPDHASGSSRMYELRGRYRLEANDPQGAIADCTEAIRLDPKNHEAWSKRGDAKLRLGKFDEALPDLEAALGLSKANAGAYLGRAQVRLVRKEYDGSLEDCDAALRLWPDYALAHATRGAVRLSKLDMDGAVRDFNRTLELDPTHLPAVSNRGLALLGKRDWEAALRDFDTVLGEVPNLPGALHNRALLRVSATDAKFRDMKAAYADAKRACELTGWKDAAEVDLLALVCAELGQFEDAVKYQKQALSDAEFAKAYGDEARTRLKAYEQKKPAPPTGK